MHSRVCPFPLSASRHPRASSALTGRTMPRCRKSLQGAGASRQGCQEHGPGETEYSLHVKKGRVTLHAPDHQNHLTGTPLFENFPEIMWPKICSCQAELGETPPTPPHLGPWAALDSASVPHSKNLISQKIHMPHTQPCPLVNAQIGKASTYYSNEDVQLINFLGVTDEQEKAH